MQPSFGDEKTPIFAVVTDINPFNGVIVQPEDMGTIVVVDTFPQHGIFIKALIRDFDRQKGDGKNQ